MVGSRRELKRKKRKRRRTERKRRDRNGVLRRRKSIKDIKTEVTLSD